MKILSYIFILMLFICPYCIADITVRWDANTETDLAGYKLYYKVNEPGEPHLGIGIDQGVSPIDIPLADLADINAPEFTITGNDATYIYFLVLTAYDDVGNESGYSNEVNTFYISSLEDGFIINYNNYQAFPISGRAAAGTPVNIYANGTFVGVTTPISDSSWEIVVDFTGIPDGTIEIHAETQTTVTLSSDIFNGILDITAPSPPSIPQNLSAIVISDSQINLAWDEVEGVAGYTVYRDGVELASIDEPNFNNTGLKPATTYEYEVSVLNSQDKSELISVTTSSENDASPPSGGGSSGGGCFIQTITR